MKMNSNELKNVIIIPGLGDEIKRIKLATSWWKSVGLYPHVVRMGWRDGSSDFSKKLREVERMAEELAGDGQISIVGTSAGGSASLNLLFERPDIIKNVVSICGRLRVGESPDIPTTKFLGTSRMLDQFYDFVKIMICRHTKRIPANTFIHSEQYKQSVSLIESREVRFSDELRKRIMTVSSKYWDEFVPSDTSDFKGANNLYFPTVEHVFSIALALTFFAKPIINFLNE